MQEIQLCLFHIHCKSNSKICKSNQATFNKVHFASDVLGLLFNTTRISFGETMDNNKPGKVLFHVIIPVSC